MTNQSNLVQGHLSDSEHNEANFGTYIGNSPVAIYVFSPDGFFLDVNLSAFTMLGFSKKELLALHISQIVSKEDFVKGLEAFDVLQTKGHYTNEFVFLRKDGSKFKGLVSGVKIFETQYLGFVRIIDEL